jgi:hypothetical protein
LFRFYCVFFLRYNFCFSHKIVIFTEKCHEEHGINCPTIILEESDLPWYVFSLSTNSLLAKCYKTQAAYWTPDSLYTAWLWNRTKGLFFNLRPDNSGVTYRISINKQLRDFTQADCTSCGDRMQCVALSNLTRAKDEPPRHPFTTLWNQRQVSLSSISKVLSLFCFFKIRIVSYRSIIWRRVHKSATNGYRT